MLSDNTLTRMPSGEPPPFLYSRLDGIESLDGYWPGGYHPVNIGDVLAGGRYRVLHKLGYGAYSTVWLAREQRQDSSQDSRTLVTLKVMTAEASSTPITEIADISIPRELEEFSRSVQHPRSDSFRLIKDHFLHTGPNGTHLCLVTEAAGPDLSTMCLVIGGRMPGSRRLRSDLARSVAKQVSNAVDFMHSAGVIHGDLTASNVVFRLSDAVYDWSDDQLYAALGTPKTDKVDGVPPGPLSPLYVVAPVDISRLSSSSILQDRVTIIDFGQSFLVDRPPEDYKPAIQSHYESPEGFFHPTATYASEVWALGCLLFEIRTGYALFDPFFSDDYSILKQIVETFGKLPEPLWSLWEGGTTCFDYESGEPRSKEEQKERGIQAYAKKTPLVERLRKVGSDDDPPEQDEGDMIEKTGTPIDEEEIRLFVDLLEKMMRYKPEDRISTAEVVRHPWFGYSPK